jgi:hypothetical protein
LSLNFILSLVRLLGRDDSLLAEDIVGNELVKIAEFEDDLDGSDDVLSCTDICNLNGLTLISHLPRV